MITPFSLIVVIVIDQLRTDDILRFQNSKAPSGISKIVNSGIFYDDAHHSHFYNKTCPGHVAISTGSVPALTGVTSNDFWDPIKKRMAYCLEDENEQLLDAPEDNKRVTIGRSAKLIETSTLGDELKILNGSDSKNIAISLKDRSAIGLGGHWADGVYWYAPLSKIWTTSTAYQKNGKLPEWIKKFNAASNSAWNELKEPYEQSARSVQDTTQLALTVFREEKLGFHKKTDLLWISYSAHDAISHSEGSNSDQLRALMKVEDENISKLIEQIQKRLGKKRFMVVLTSDHGGGPVTKKIKPQGIPSGQMNYENLKKNLNICLQSKVKIEDAHGLNIYIETKGITNQITIEEERKLVRECLTKEEGVWYAFTREEIMQNRLPNTPWLKKLYQSYIPKKGADVVGVLKPYWNSGDLAASNHETSYVYDSWVPLAFWWSDIRRSKTIHKRVEINNLAPTLSRILKTSRPSGSTGEYLEDVLNAL